MSSDNPERRELVARVVAAIRANADQSDRLDQLGARRFGLNRTDSRSVEILRRLGPLTANKLAEQLGMTTGGVTTVIDRLEQAGYARRRDHEDDRRLVLIEATKLAAQRENEIFGELIEGTANLVNSFADGELLLIERFLNEVGKLAAGHADHLAAQPARPTDSARAMSRKRS
jgi:DNA-binding MarR family transcriptional regulator